MKPGAASRGAAPWFAFGALVLAAFVIHGGPRMVDLGFYHEDWTFLSYMHFAPPTYAGRLSALIASEPVLLSRPTTAPLWAAAYTFFGERAILWHVWCLLINAFMGFAVWLILRRFSVPPRMAIAGALIALAWPSKDSTVLWPIVFGTALSMLGWLTAYFLHLEWARTGRLAFFAAAAAVLLVSLATYDQCFFLTPLFALVPADERHSAPRAFRGAGALLALTAAYLVFKFVYVFHFLCPMPYEKTVVLSPRHFLYVYLAGLEVNAGPRMLWGAARAVPWAWRWSPLAAAAACALPWLASRADTEEPRISRLDALRLGLLGAGMFVAGYLPIAVSDYSPAPLDPGTRVNLTPMIGLLFAAAAWVSSRRGRGTERVMALAASAALLVHVGYAAQWAESSRRQDQIKNAVLSGLPQWPKGTTLILRLPERYVAGKAPVFDSGGDFRGATRIWTGDPERLARVLSPRTAFVRDGVSESGAPPVLYERLRLLDMTAGGRISTADEGTFRRLPPAL
jgi:hypothetical protein